VKEKKDKGGNQWISCRNARAQQQVWLYCHFTHQRLSRANHLKGWDAKLLAYVPSTRNRVAEPPGETRRLLWPVYRTWPLGGSMHRSKCVVTAPLVESTTTQAQNLKQLYQALDDLRNVVQQILEKLAAIETFSLQERVRTEARRALLSPAETQYRSGKTCASTPQRRKRNQRNRASLQGSPGNHLPIRSSKVTRGRKRTSSEKKPAHPRKRVSLPQKQDPPKNVKWRMLGIPAFILSGVTLLIDSLEFGYVSLCVGHLIFAFEYLKHVWRSSVCG